MSRGALVALLAMVVLLQFRRCTPTPARERAMDDTGEYNVFHSHNTMHRLAAMKSFSPIPRIVHQVWVGDLGQAVCQWMDTFRVQFLAQNPGWEYRLWTREAYEARYGKMVLAAVYDAEPKPAAKADVLRYEVVWRQGGVYMDADSVWLGRPMDTILADAKDTGMFGVAHDERLEAESEGGIRLYLNGIFGASPCHPLMELIVLNLRVLYADLRYRQRLSYFRCTGPHFFSHVLRDFNITSVPRDVFAPGAWFFDLKEGEGMDAFLERRAAQMRQQYPDAIAFQVGYSTHGLDRQQSTDRCREWGIQRSMELAGSAQADAAKAKQNVCPLD